MGVQWTPENDDRYCDFLPAGHLAGVHKAPSLPARSGETAPAQPSGGRHTIKPNRAFLRLSEANREILPTAQDLQRELGVDRSRFVGEFIIYTVMALGVAAFSVAIAWIIIAN